MKHRLTYSFFRYLLITLAAGLPMQASAIARPKPLITDYNQLRVNQLEQNEGAYGQFAGFLIDRNPFSYYHSNYTYGDTNKPEAIPAVSFIEVTLHEPTRRSQNLHIYNQVRSGIVYAQPTRFRIDGSTDGIYWTQNIATVDIPFNGTDNGQGNPGEEIFSPRFTLPDGYKYLRFVCEENWTTSSTASGHRKMFLAEFQLYECDDDLSAINTNKNLLMADPSHKIIDYTDHYRDFKFIHTRGVVNASNHNTPNLLHWCDWSKWVEGAWADNPSLAADNIELPDFSYINRITAPYGRVKEGDRQRTHVTEHTVYAIPGQVTTLYPFSDIYFSNAYHENYNRWYDYSNDKSNPYLDFLHDPAAMSPIASAGYLGGNYLGNASTDRYDVYIYTVEDYINFMIRVNNGETRLSAMQCADLDFAGRTDIYPIGIDQNNAFRGIYEGSGYGIRNLVIDKAADNWDYVGMFGHVGSCIIRNLNIHQSCRFAARNGVGLIGAVNAKEYENLSEPGTLLVHNVSTAATVQATGKNAGGILGVNNRWSGPFQVFIANCAVLGNISGSLESAAISGWVGKYSTVRDCYSDATVSGVEGTNSFVRGTVCLHGNNFDRNRGNGLPGLPYHIADERLATAINSAEWQGGGWGYVLPKAIRSERFGSNSRGAIATFYCPADKDFDTQYIAVDFSQTFRPEVHINYANKTITEPIIAFRHIFKVENAKNLAEEVSGSPEKNAEYIAKKRRTIRARAGVDFQVRFEHPQPVEQDTRTTMFYKDPQGVVRRVRKSRIKVTDRDGNERPGIFYQTADYTRPTARQLKYGELPDMYDVGKQYSRMMKCDAANAHGRFTVHLVGCDENGNELRIYGSDKELILAEYVVNFVDENGAAMTSESEMYSDKYAHTRPATLNELYGNPIAVVNFDNYRMLEKLPNRNDYIYDGPAIPGGTTNSHKYKWPVPWSQSQYAFGYDDPEDYNMYMLADHSAVTPYHAAADHGTMEQNFGKGTGRFDRLFYDTQGRERGYFYYANAASDPGVMASLNTSDLCPGSTLFVSAWLCEFSNASEVQNIIFNFKVVEKKTGTEHIIHSFVTGYVPKETIGQWQHVYYQFTPNLSQLGLTSQDIESYQLVLENNCLSSAGADYAIDDVRVYVARPRVYATQTMPLCRGEQGTDVMVETPFDVMLATLGTSEASTEMQSTTIDCYYTFVDKDKYDKAIAAGEEGTVAFEKAVVRYDYIPGQGNDQTYGHLTFETHFRSNPTYDKNNTEVSSKAFATTIDGDRYLVINTRPKDKNLITGKEYIVALYVNEHVDGEEIHPDAAMFDISSKCAKSSVFRIHASGVIKIDGVIVPNLDNITVCQNQTPVVQIDIQSRDHNGSFSNATPNAITDWWDGSMEDFLAQVDPETKLPLNTVLSVFRQEYPESDTWDVPAQGDYTEGMRAYLQSLAEPDTENGTPARLILYQSSYVFRPVTIPPGEESTHIYAVAVPIDIYSDELTVCTTPSEVRLTVRNNSPELNHGLNINYPAWIDDVPLRIGLRQLDSVSSPDGTNSQKLLSIPVRMVSVVTEGVDALECIPDDHSVYLVQTDDPEYLDLNVETENGVTTGLYPVGALNEIVARPSSTTGNELRLAFDNEFNFKEGHYYRLRFSFRENGVPSLPTGDDGEGEPRHCFGQHVFSIKVVPEYQAWVGAADSTNWSNDNNWRRVSATDLLHTTSANDGDLDRFVTDRGELTATAKSFVPMDFTKVIIPAGASVPHLYEGASSPVTVGGKNYLWLTDLTAPSGISAPTDDIAFDMAAQSSDAGVSCRPWYTNTCDEIHFHSNSSILGQTMLAHNRAWVDFEIEPGMWYTLGSPLTGVVAGDMYLPTDGARQTTELFKPITFSETLHDRFAPAVYQRSWNKARAMVYELGGSTAGTNVAVRTTWSHVYNEVAEPYGTPASGFSIKADVSKLENPEEIEHVMFRLPKDDASYLYYDNNGGNPGHNTTINRSAGNKLHKGNGGEITTTVSAAAPSRYFMVGNPFMAHMDMAAFLRNNSNEINPKYWVMNSEGQACAIYNERTGDFESTLDEPELLAPLQGFFVESKNEVSSLTLRFNGADTKAVAYDPTKGNFLRTPALSTDESACSRSASAAMRITAMRGEKPLSQAMLVIDASADENYDEAEDVAMIFDSHRAGSTAVYTIAGNMAASVNAIPAVTATELCVSAEADDVTVLRFDGTDTCSGAMLADVVTGETMPLYNGMEYEIRGAAASRLYIVSATDDMLPSNAIMVAIDGNDMTVTAPDNGFGIDITVHDMTGRVVAQRRSEENTIRMTLDRGVYLLEARNAEVEPLRTKILIQR